VGPKVAFEQFAIASSVVLTLSVVGGWVGARIADGVLRGTSGAAALYMTNFVEPHVQAMDGDGSPTPEDARRLDAVSELLKSRRHAASIKIWQALTARLFIAPKKSDRKAISHNRHPSFVARKDPRGNGRLG
jgi:hypothetical protein